MAISIITTPDILSPVSDMYGNYFQLSYANFTASNFKYVTKLWVADQLDVPTYTLLVQENIPARPVTGYGLYSGYQSLLTKLGYSLDQNANTAVQPRNTLLSYFISYGLEYNPNENITAFAGLGGNTKITVPNPSKFAIGDTINIQSQNAQMSGLANIVGFSGGLPIINKGLGTSTVNTGLITDLVHWDGTSSVYYAYNGTREYGETSDNIYYLKYTMGLSASGIPESKPFLSTYPTGVNKKIMTNQYEMLGAFLATPGFTGSGAQMNIDCYDSNNVFLGNIIQSASIVWNAKIKRIDYNVSSYILNSTYPTSKYYKVKSLNTLGVQKSEIRTYEIDSSCSVYNNVRIMWMNRHGSWEFFNFRLVDTKTYNITRNEFKQVLPFNPLTNDYQYATGARERTTQNLKIVESHTINTDYITEDLYGYLGGIETSPEVYRINEVNGLAYPIMVTDTKFLFKRAYVDQIMNFTMTYETSYGIETQYQ